MVQMDGASPKPLLGRLRLLGITKGHVRLFSAIGFVALFFVSRWSSSTVSRNIEAHHDIAEASAPLDAPKVLSVLKQIYGSAQVHHGDALDVKERKSMGEAAVYGEILPESVGTLFDVIGGLSNDDFFVDLGSGTGKICIQAHLSTLSGKVLGVELGKQRHLRAIQALGALKELGLRDLKRQIAFVQEDAMQVVDTWREASVIFMNSLRFPRALMCNLAETFLKLAPGSLVISSKPLPGCRRCCKLLQTLRLKASWHDMVKIHIYAVPPSSGLHADTLLYGTTAASLRDQIATRVANKWPAGLSSNSRREALLGDLAAVEWTLTPVLGEEFSLASCILRDTYECSVEAEASPLDVGKLPAGGNMLPSGMDTLLRNSNLSKATLIVVSSGEGHFPLYVALTTDASNILGLESTHERHHRAELALEAMQRRKFVSGQTSIRFANVKVSQYGGFSEWDKAAAVVLMSAFWLPEELVHLQPYFEKLPPCSHVFSLQPLPGCHPGLTAQKNIRAVPVSWNTDGTDVWHYLRDGRRSFTLGSDGTVARSEAQGLLYCGAQASMMLPVQVAQCTLVDAAAASPPPPDGCGIWSSKVLQDNVISAIGGLLSHSVVAFIGPGWYVTMFLVSMLWPVHVSLYHALSEELLVARALHEQLSVKGVIDAQRSISFEPSGNTIGLDSVSVAFVNARWALEARWHYPSNVSLIVCCDGDASRWLAASDSQARELHVELTCARDEGVEVSRRLATVYIRTARPDH